MTLPLINATNAFGSVDSVSYVIFVALSVIYSACVVYSVENNDSSRIVPLEVFAVLVSFIMFTGPMKNGLIKNIGIGFYQTNIAVKKEYLLRLPSEIKVTDENVKGRVNTRAKEAKKYDAAILNSVWVAAALTDKLILAASEEMKITYTIPS